MPWSGPRVSPGSSLGVPARRDVERLRVRLDDGMEQRIESFDPLQIGPGEFGGAQAAGGDERVELGDRRLEPRGVRIGVLARISRPSMPAS